MTRLLILITCILFFAGCQSKHPVREVSVNEVASMTIENALDNTKVTYTGEKDKDEIAQFVRAYNKVKSYRQDVGTTPPGRIVLSLKNNEEIWVWGGNEDFQAVKYKDKQMNVKGDLLDNYFKNKVFSSTNLVVPFIIENAQDGSQQEVFLGFWDLRKGRVSFENRPLFKVKGKGYRIYWDGGPRIAVSPDRFEPDIDLREINPDFTGFTGFTVEKTVKSSCFDIIKCPSHKYETIIVPGPLLEAKPLLEVRGGFEGKKVIINPNLPFPDSVINRPVAVSLENGKIDIYYEFSTCSKEKIPVHGLIMGTFDGRSIKWRIISDDLEISEAGAGTKMTKHGSQIVISEQDARVKMVDIATGKVIPHNVVNNCIERFRKENVKMTECPTPASVFSFKGLLIIEWVPAAIEEKEISGEKQINFIPTAYILAVKDGKVLGEIKAKRDKLEVIKDGKVTEKKKIPAHLFPSWQFPQEN